MRITTIAFAFLLLTLNCKVQNAFLIANSTTIPLAGNTFFNNYGETGIELTETGISNWTDPSVSATIYVRFLEKGTYSFVLNTKANNTRLNVKIGQESKEVNINASQWTKYPIGSFRIVDTGYVAIELKGLEKTDATFADIQSLEINASPDKFQFVKDEFYWGRRGPSVHLNYTLPKQDIEWFYNEITIPKGKDIIGSYYMSNGFEEGYFGIQVNSDTERRILFSVWSPFTTDDPKTIPDDMKIVLLGKGNGVHTGEFGNEGSGGQSYLIFNWQAEVTYSFLTRIKPNSDNSTTYTAYFYDPLTDKWHLIASFKRPKTKTWYTQAHSFLENFDPERGAVNRKGFYSNQWACNTEGVWTELTKARFTNDATARKKARMDFMGGVENNQFVLSNCGFFSHYTPLNRVFERKPNGLKPNIDFRKLPNE
jgi:Domain of unknown function (DUF3472)/Domain of unknown function (DUF5077)